MSTNPLSLIVTVFNTDKQKETADQLGAFLSRTKQALDIVLVSGAPGAELTKWAEAQGDKVKLVTPGPWISQATLGEHAILLDASQLQQLNTLSTWYAAQRRNLQPGRVYVPDPSGKTDSKQKSANGTGLYNFFARTLTPVNAKGTGYGIFVADCATMQAVLAHTPLRNARFGASVAARASYLGYEVETFPLTLKPQPLVNPGITGAIREAVAGRWFWFVKYPLQEVKKEGWLKALGQPQHPIYRFLFMALSALILILLPALSFDYGVTWDEPEDQAYFERVFKYFVTFGEDRSSLDDSNNLNAHLVNYGPFVNLLCITVYKVLNTFMDAGLYETRHFVIALFGVVGMIYTGLLAKRISNWRTAFLASLFIFATPFIFGHSMNNQKDIPFMAFYAVSLYYMVGFVSQMPKPNLRTSLFLALAMGITMSIRIGGLLVFAYLLLFCGVNWLLSLKQKGVKPVKLAIRYLVLLVPVLALAYVVGIIFWPYALQDPINHPIEALKNFEKFSLVQIFEIFDGERYHMKGFPWYYLPKSILITTPLFILAGIVLFFGGSVQLMKRLDWRHLLVLVFITVFPLIYVIYKKSAVYSSWRHLYFIYPGMVVMAAIGWNWLGTLTRQPWFRIAVSLVLAVLIIKPTAWAIKNHPYEYVYYNEIVGGFKGAYGNYETDYWCQSPRKAVEWLMDHEGIDKRKTAVISNNDWHTLAYYTEKRSKDISILWAREHEWHKQNWDYAIWTTRTLSKKQLENGYFPPKGTIHVIEVDGLPLAAIVKRENDFLFRGNQYIDKRQYDSAVFFLNQAYAYDPLEEEASRQLGFAYLATNQLDSAEKYLKISVEVDPENYLSYLYLAYIDAGRNKLDDAVAKAKLAIKYKVNYSQAYELAGNIYMQSQNFGEAKKYFETMLVYTQNESAYNGLGKAHLGLKNYDKAVECFDIAIRVNPNYAEAYQNMIYALNEKGDKETAAKYQQALQQLMGGGAR